MPEGHVDLRGQSLSVANPKGKSTQPEDNAHRIKQLESLLQTIARGKYMWESTFDAITSPVTIISSGYVILRANKSAAKLANLDVRELIGTKCFESLAGLKEPCNNCPASTTFKNHLPNFHALDPFKKNHRQFEVNSYPLETTHEDQTVMHYRDVTEQKELQNQLLHSGKMAAIGTLAGGVAHELNNPLGGILAFVQLALRELAPEHPSYTDLQEAEQATLRCKRIVQDLLEFSRQNKEEMASPVQLNEVLKRVIPLVNVQARTSRIQIHCNYEKNLPMIRANFHKLQQVFLNIITNAFQSMGQRGALKIRTEFDANKSEVMITIEDNGPGIPPAIIDKIFDPYFTTKKQGEGTGLGLSITYGIIQEFKGSIEAKSTEGKGAIFTLRFPALF